MVSNLPDTCVRRCTCYTRPSTTPPLYIRINLELGSWSLTDLKQILVKEQSATLFTVDAVSSRVDSTSLAEFQETFKTRNSELRRRLLLFFFFSTLMSETQRYAAYHTSDTVLTICSVLVPNWWRKKKIIPTDELRIWSYRMTQYGKLTW